jgi:hypothetical protein
MSNVVTAAILKPDPDGAAAGSRSTVCENSPNLKDWTLFRTVEGLQQKAGVPVALLRRLVLKELDDKADIGSTCQDVRFVPKADMPSSVSE